MICKNCSAEYEDSYDVCPECGTEKAENEITEAPGAEAEENTEASEGEVEAEETQQPQEDEITDEESSSDSEAESENEAQENAAEEDGNVQETDVEAEDDVEADNADVAGDREVKEVKSLPEKSPAHARRPIKTRRKTTLRPVYTPTKTEKRVSAFIIVLMCLVGALAVGLSVVNMKTDLFEVSFSEEKMVASVGFTPQEEKELEELLAKCYSAAKKEYKCETADSETFLERINPADRGNIYSTLNNTVAVLQSEADPADRFANENGEYAYYRLEESKVDAVLSLFGLEGCHEANCKDYYYFDGYYYFAQTQATETPVVAAEIIKSRRVLDGSFYVECYFYLEQNPETAKTGTCYVVIEKQTDENGEAAYKIAKISAQPIFGSDGNLLDSIKTCQKQKEVMEGRTDDGKLFSRYIIEYPLVEGEGAGYQNVKDFFKNAISVYQLKAEGAQKEYEAFKEKGGTDSQLPFTESITAKVAFEDEKNISIVGKFTTFTPEPESQQAEEESYYGEPEAESEPVKLGVRSVEAYTFDKQSGNFVSKDSVLGKDYMLISEILYRIYNSYDYEEILPEEGETGEEAAWQDEYSYGYDTVPDDTDGIGTKIYESAWSLSDEGVTFYYIAEEGYIQEITLPYSVIERITQ